MNLIFIAGFGYLHQKNMHILNFDHSHIAHASLRSFSQDHVKKKSIPMSRLNVIMHEPVWSFLRR